MSLEIEDSRFIGDYALGRVHKAEMTRLKRQVHTLQMSNESYRKRLQLATTELEVLLKNAQTTLLILKTTPK